MKRNDPVFWAASQIHRHLVQNAGKVPSDLARRVEELLSSQRSVESAWGRNGKAQHHGWHMAAQQVRRELFSYLRDLQYELTQVMQLENQLTQPDLGVPTLSFLMAEIQQLQVEMDVDIKPKEGIIVAKTDPIELEGILLGDFAIELHVGRMSRQLDSSCFDCVALDPNSASCNEDVVHPHVQCKQLCAGEATYPIAQALKQGRLADAFTLIKSVLNTYNEGSPYVALEDWNGVRCHDCDCLTDRDELYTCEMCDHSFCSDCSSSCDICGLSCCRSCLERDRESNQDCCCNCRHTCSKCGRTVDSESFVTETELCPECHEEEQDKSNNKENDHDSEITQSAPAAA